MKGTPLLPQEELHSFVEEYFARGKALKKRLQAGDLPAYVLETSVLKQRAREFKKVFFDVLPNVDFYFAVKSNNHPQVANSVMKCGFGLDVSSGLELQMALDLNAKKIIFSGSGKTTEELRLAVENAGRVTVLIDSFGELSRLQKVAEEVGFSVRAGVRISTSPNWSKFGITLDELPSFYQRSQECSLVKFSGIQFHSSWNLSPDAQCAFIEKLAAQLRLMPKDFTGNIEFLDVGGGYWPQLGEWLQPAGTPEGKLQLAGGREVDNSSCHHRMPAMALDKFAAQLSQAVERHIQPLVDCRICFEPGRWVCNDAMHLLLTVIDKKGEDLAITDAGTNAVGWERFEVDYCPVLNLSRPSMEEKACNIMGSLCTPRDFWGYTYFGEGIEEGDVLMIPCQGAYTYSLRQEFIKPLPQVIVT